MSDKELYRVQVSLREGVRDAVGFRALGRIREMLGISPDSVKIIRVFTISGLSRAQVLEAIEKSLLFDPVMQTASLEPVCGDFDWAIEVGFRPGVTDNEGKTAKEALVLGLGIEDAPDLAVYTLHEYLLWGKLSEAEVERIAREFLANELIQRFEYKSRGEWERDPGFKPIAARVTGKASSEVETIDLASMDDGALIALSRECTLALSLEEMRAIRDYFTDPNVVARRKSVGLGVNPTDAELECLAQTWSEHCKHKIFNASIDYSDMETGRTEKIRSLFKDYIQHPTQVIRDRLGKDDFCLSVFKDNAGVIAINEEYAACIKVETHNSPSALDPYGGALTGIVGVNRDPMGTGMGANLLFNTDVFCFASPFHTGELPPRLLHPRRVMEGVREGVEHGGNKSGIPTVNGAIVFDQRYLGKPLVFCGTVGVMPAHTPVGPGHEKKANPGDRIIMVGGRIGKDGIHGATFSSEELHEGSPATAVQIGDPITQRKMYDFLMRARDLGLYNSITDNGAGGLSSSVGETATDTGGCDMDLAGAPLKYDGLRPWEILLSEAQERMTLAVPSGKVDEFMRLAREMDVLARDLGEFTDSGYFHVRYRDRTVAYIDMRFLHDGTPEMRLKAKWKKPVFEKTDAAGIIPDNEKSGADFLLRMMSGLNICSREYVIRQYDHEVQGGSVIKPLVGLYSDAPGDAAVVRPILGTNLGLVTANGICPKFSDFDTYWMMASAIDEAVRNAVCAGGDIRRMAGVDNFCWCDPVQSEKTPDGEYKLAQLVRANKALAHFCLAFGIPCVSGKDSMKNDYYGGGVKISIPPTVLFTVLGVIPDVNKCVSSDFKKPGDMIYLLGLTGDELGGSEAARELGISGYQAPQVNVLEARERYLALHEAMNRGLVSFCHDLSDGGLAVAVCESAIGGRLGADIDLSAVPVCPKTLTPWETMYSESASRLLVGVAPENAQEFEAMFSGRFAARIGQVTDTDRVTFWAGNEAVVGVGVEALTAAFKKTFAW